MNPTPPEVDRLIAGGPEPTRTRNPTHIGAAALVLALGGLGVHAIMQDDGDDTAPPASAAEPTVTAAPSRVVMGPPPLPSDPGGQPLQAGSYRLLAGFDRIGARIDADLTVEGEGWVDGNFPVLRVGEFYGGVAVYQTHGLAAGSGCNNEEPDFDLGRADLAEKLSRLPGSTVVQPVTPVRAFWHDALHLRLRIRDTCAPRDTYRVAETPRGSHGITYSDGPTTVVMDFWVVDVAGTDVVVDTWHQRGSSAYLVSQLAEVRDSILFVKGR